MKFDLLGGTAESRCTQYNSTVRKNCYVEISESENSKSKTIVIGTPGLSLFVTVNPRLGSECRGLITTSNGKFFALVGDTFAEIYSNGTVTVRGYIGTTSGYLKMVENGVDILIVDGIKGYLYNLNTETLLELNTTNFPNSAGFPTNPTGAVFIDQYFIVSKGGTYNFYLSGLLDGETWDALDVGTVEYSPDSIVNMETLRSNIWFFNQNTIEVFYDSGATDFPFERVNGAVQEFGCDAARSVAKLNNSVFWIGSSKDGNKVIFKSNGYNAVRISTHEIEYKLSQMYTVSDAVGFTYQQEGHYFYQINFPTGDCTLAWDDSTSLWHERTYKDSNGNIGRSKAQFHALFNGVNYVGDYNTGNIYEYDLDTYTDDGEEIIRVLTAPVIHNDEKYIYFKKIELDINRGVGIANGQGSDPKVMLRWSDDGGNTWSNTYLMNVGKVGEYTTRCELYRLGRARSRLFEFSMSDPVPFNVMSCIVDMDVQ